MAKETLSKPSIQTMLQGFDSADITATVCSFDTATGADTSGAMAVYDKEGNLLGYVPLFAAATLAN